MVQTKTNTSDKHVLAKTLAILLSLVLFICLLIPIQNARLNTQEQYQELYKYKKQASIYYLTINISRRNLDKLTEQLNNISVKDPIMSNGVLTIYSVMKKNSNLLILDRKLSSLVGLYFYDLKKLPDPGHADLVNAVNDYYDSYNLYRDYLQTSPKDADTYYKNLSEIQKKVSDVDTKLQKILAELE